MHPLTTLLSFNSSPGHDSHAPKSTVMVTTLSRGPDAHAPQAMTTRLLSTAASAPWRPIGDAASTDGRRHVNVPRSSTCASFRKAPCRPHCHCERSCKVRLIDLRGSRSDEGNAS